ncbi:hypothetical protein RND71_018251 [Anisodus tanguticus]|uniref:Uncharacterized protein n=1 Tax=Anisodus tanguticus TaxID=243964 RepID=A0AAE1VK12_9SOLA|nr:hypothetical protein RND71_018251 [Anisodus tanguticus]
MARMVAWNIMNHQTLTLRMELRGGCHGIVCRILTENPVKMRFFQDAMAQAWMPGECMTMKDLGNNCFLV